MRIEITVSPTGEITVQTKGFAGTSCKDATKALEKALGIVHADKPTAEMHQSMETQTQLKTSS